jgi:hypothetical protein
MAGQGLAIKPHMKAIRYLLPFLCPLIAGAQTYNLENLAAGPLINQDGWRGSAPIQVLAAPTFDASKVLTSNAPGTPLINSRVNNALFSFPSLSSMDSAVVLQLDYRAENNAAELWFGVGVDLNGDGAIEGSNERGFGFGHYRNTVGMTDAFSLSQLDGSHAAYPAAYGDAIRLRMVVDMSGFAGEGSASLYYQNLSAGDAGFTLVFANQNLDIRDTDHTAEAFNGVFLALSSGVQADNFTVVPEPASCALLSAAAILATPFRRRGRSE